METSERKKSGCKTLIEKGFLLDFDNGRREIIDFKDTYSNRVIHVSTTAGRGTQ